MAVIMFDPELTIESGIERVGEILDGRSIDVSPNDPIFNQIREYREALHILYENDAIEVYLGGVELVKPEFADLFEKVTPGGVGVLEAWRRQQVRARYYSSGSAHFSKVLDEALMNAFEYGDADEINIRHLVGREGEFYVISQKTPGPAFEEIQEKHLSGESLRYKKGKYPRGYGFHDFAERPGSVWYVDLDPGYATLIFDKSSGYVHDWQKNT